MEWKAETPSSPGWYWAKPASDGEIGIVYLFERWDGVLATDDAGIDGQAVAEINEPIEWAGPVYPPTYDYGYHRQQADHYMDYLTGIRVFFVLSRRKDDPTAPHGHMSRSVTKRITNGKEEAIATMRDLIDIVGSAEKLRLYVSVNSRDVDKAVLRFRHLQIDADYADPAVKRDFYLDTKNRWVSCLMQPASRAESNFLFDCDSEEQTDSLMKKLGEGSIKVKGTFKTKSGRHVITEPHNPSLSVVQGVSLHKDGLLLLEWSERLNGSTSTARA